MTSFLKYDAKSYVYSKLKGNQQEKHMIIICLKWPILETKLAFDWHVRFFCKNKTIEISSNNEIGINKVQIQPFIA